ncbi:MAG: TFIIB-type zinc ribbon-containing protein [Candidatus Rehaiarchaeum fermentans]|nr:hypothetical protein [Candidatus Rehaiarchaeum fermentans]MCW1302635.1 hypothetical protein [Candidatus Rehaiarchaeum fermentans]
MADNVILYTERKCPTCGGTDFEISISTGELICRKCGTIIEAGIDFSKEGGSHDLRPDENKNRLGSSISYARPDIGLSIAAGSTGDTLKLSPKGRQKANEIKIWQSRISTPAERNLRIPLNELRHAAESLNLPNVVIEEAAKIYRDAASRRLVRGRSMSGMIAGAIYAAARKYNYAITLEEIAESMGISKKEIGKAYRLLYKELNLKILPPSPKDYLYKYAAAMKVNSKVLNLALELLQKAESKGILSGKGPSGVAAAILYIACVRNGEKITQRDVANKSNITEVTIRNRVKELEDALK